MSRRSGGKSVTVERPRQKGWWGEPNQIELEPEFDTERLVPAKETPRRATHVGHAPIAVGRALTPAQIDAIRTIMRLFIDDDTANGVDPRRVLYCHRCDAPRPAIGSVRYDRLTLCNPCSTEYEIARARAVVDSATDFTDRFPVRAATA